MDLLNSVYMAIKNEVMVIHFEAKILEKYFRKERVCRGGSNHGKTAWSKYVLFVRAEKDREFPRITWQEVIPIKKAPSHTGKKKVLPKWRHLPIGGKGTLAYRMSSFGKATPWERDLIGEVEHKATGLRRRVALLKQILKSMDSYMAEAKAGARGIRAWQQALGPDWVGEVGKQKLVSGKYSDSDL